MTAINGCTVVACLNGVVQEEKTVLQLKAWWWTIAGIRRCGVTSFYLESDARRAD
jgi:hypothetical protein